MKPPERRVITHLDHTGAEPETAECGERGARQKEEGCERADGAATPKSKSSCRVPSQGRQQHYSEQEGSDVQRPMCDAKAYRSAPVHPERSGAQKGSDRKAAGYSLSAVRGVSAHVSLPFLKSTQRYCPSAAGVRGSAASDAAVRLQRRVRRRARAHEGAADEHAHWISRHTRRRQRSSVEPHRDSGNHSDHLARARHPRHPARRPPKSRPDRSRSRRGPRE